MKKIIEKVKLSSRDSFKGKLSDIELNFSPVYWEHDRIFVPRNYKKGMNLPRLVMRTTMKAVDKPAKYSLILRRHIEDSGIDLVEEISTKDYEAAVAIILQLGFKLAGEVSRRREALDMGEETYIYIDKIENLPGYYAKIESKLSEHDSVTEAREDLRRTFRTLGESTFIDEAYFEIKG